MKFGIDRLLEEKALRGAALIGAFHVAAIAGSALALAACKGSSAPAAQGDAGPAASEGLTPEQSAQVLARVGDRTITLGEYVAACLANVLSLDDALFAATEGEVPTTDRALELAIAEGAAPVSVIRAGLMHLQRLHRARLHPARRPFHPIPLSRPRTAPARAARAAHPAAFLLPANDVCGSVPRAQGSGAG